MRNPMGYKVLRTYQQGKEILELTRLFTSEFLHYIADSRLIGHMDDSARSVPRNISEGYGRNDTKKYWEFLGYALASLLELLEDYLALEKEIKGERRKTKDNQEALRIISKAIKLSMGEKTMLTTQMDEIEKMAGDQGLIPHNRKVARIVSENERSRKEFDRFISAELEKAKNQNKGNP